MFSRIANIWRKELTDTVRDRKAFIHALIVPLAIGILYAVLNPVLMSMAESRAEEPLAVPVQGLTRDCGDLATVLERFGITLEPFEGDLAAAVAHGDRAAGLVIPPGFSDSVTQEEDVTLILLTNPTSGGIFGGQISVKRLEIALQAYNHVVAVKRLAVRGLRPDLLAPVTLDARDLSSPAQRAGLFAAIMLPLLVGIVAAQGGLFIAIDVTAGEKERGTLEALLLTPCSDAEIFAGKLGAVFTLTSVPVVLTLVGFWTAANLLPGSMTHGAVLPLDVVVRTILVALPLALFLNVVLMVVSVRTRSFRDAQSSSLPFFFVVMSAAMAAAFLPPTNPLLYLIPIYGTSAVVGGFASGIEVPALSIFLSVAGSFAGVGLGSFGALSLFNRERLLYKM
jgi:sodium transport system permease protein